MKVNEILIKASLLMVGVRDGCSKRLARRCPQSSQSSVVTRSIFRAAPLNGWRRVLRLLRYCSTGCQAGLWWWCWQLPSCWPCYFKKPKAGENDEIQIRQRKQSFFLDLSHPRPGSGLSTTTTTRRRRRTVVHLIVHGVAERCCCPTTKASGRQSVWAERLVQHPRVWFVIRFLICTGAHYPNWIPSCHHCRYLHPASCPDSTGGTIPQDRRF